MTKMNFEDLLNLHLQRHNLSCNAQHILVTYRIKKISSVDRQVFYCSCPVCSGETRYVRE